MAGSLCHTTRGTFTAIVILYCCQTSADLVCAVFVALTMVFLSPSRDFSMLRRQHIRGGKGGGTRYRRNRFCSPCDEFCISVNADAAMAGYLTSGDCCVGDSLASLSVWDGSRRALCVV